METINAKDYHVNYHGKIIKISELKSSKMYILFISGSGYGDQTFYYSGSSTYDVYKVTGYDGVMSKVGTIIENSSSDKGSNFIAKIDDYEISAPVAADAMFSKIYKS